MTYGNTLKRGGPLKQRSEKREREERELDKLRPFVFARDGRCMAPVTWGPCEGRWHAHHIVSRARDHTLLLELSNLTTLCFRHHRHAHDNVRVATDCGLIASAVPSPDPQKSQT